MLCLLSGENIKAKVGSVLEKVNGAFASKNGRFLLKGGSVGMAAYSYNEVASEAYNNYSAEKSVDEVVGNAYVSAMFTTASIGVGVAASAAFLCMFTNPAGLAMLGAIVVSGLASYGFNRAMDSKIKGKSIKEMTVDYMMR